MNNEVFGGLSYLDDIFYKDIKHPDLTNLTITTTMAASKNVVVVAAAQLHKN